MKRKLFRRILCALLTLCTLLSFAACKRISLVSLPKNLVESYSKQATEPLADDEQTRREEILANYGWKLYREVLKDGTPGENQLFSPLSLEFALCMVANGSSGKTRSEIEAAMGLSVREMNEALCGILTRVENCKFGTAILANSIWMKDDGSFTARPEFLQAVADYYDAQVYAAPLDNSTVKQLNGWVKKYTEGMIPRLIDSIDPTTVMLLVNVLTFDHKWATLYESDQVKKDQIFHNYAGDEVDVTFLSSKESRFVEGNGFTGFIKSYEGPYEIMFLLPDEGLDVYAAIESLAGEDLQSLRKDAYKRTMIDVYAKIPEFSYDCTYDLILPVQKTGIELAFDDTLADFTDLGESKIGNIYIGMILQKTHIELDRNGTKAAAATIIGMKANSAAPIDREVREVILDRPFGYVIFDTEAGTPLFCGVTATLGA